MRRGSLLLVLLVSVFLIGGVSAYCIACKANPPGTKHLCLFQSANFGSCCQRYLGKVVEESCGTFTDPACAGTETWTCIDAGNSNTNWINGGCVYPGAEKTCNSGAGACDGAGNCIALDQDRDGYTPPQDCDDSNALINPNATEICDDGIDNNCNNLIDLNDSECQGLVTDVYWADMNGDETDLVDNGDWVQIVLNGSFQEGELINYSIIKDDESGEAVSGVLYNIISLDEASGVVKIPWKAEYNSDEQPYYFNITLNGNTIDSRIESSSGGLLEVLSEIDDTPTEVYITSPDLGEVYLLSDNITFSAVIEDEDSLLSQANWDFGGVVNINSPGEISGVSNYYLTKENFSQEIKASYSAIGQKNVRMMVTNQETNEVTSDQVEILITNNNTDSVLAFVSSPMENEYFESYNGVVNGSAEGSYVLSSDSGGVLTCLYGICPSQTSGIVPVPILNWNNAPALNSTDNLEFKWNIFGGLNWTRTGTQSESVNFYKYFPMGRQSIGLTLNYYEAGVLKASSQATRTFIVAEFDKISCDANEGKWYYPNGTIEGSFSNCLIGNSSCCPADSICLDSNNDGIYSCESEIPEPVTGCGKYLSEDDCNSDASQEWMNIVGEGVRNDGLLCTDGDNTKEENGTSYHLDCYCEWKNDTCRGVHELIEDQIQSPSWPLSTSHPGSSTSHPSIGKCSITKDTSGDDCSDGFLQYNWDAEFIWGPGNEYSSKTECETITGAGNCINDSIGIWRYDPVGESLKCNSGETVIICPAKVQLPFFSFWNVISGLIILIIIYSYLSFKKK